MTDPTGRSVTEVVVERDGAREAYNGDIVVVSCGAVNSAALLLRSANDPHPNGLANCSDVVGRHYMATTTPRVIAISQTPNPTKFQKTLGLNDFYWGADDFEFPLGHIQMIGKSDRKMLRAGAPLVRTRAGARLRRQARDRLLDHHRGPARTRTTGSPSTATGSIHLAKTDHNLEAHGGCWTSSRSCCLDRLPRAPRSRPVGPRQADPGGGRRPPVRHRALRRRPRRPRRSTSTARPTTSTTSTSSTRASSRRARAVNPALTAMANALRVGDHLLERLGAQVTTAGKPASDGHNRRWSVKTAERLASSIGKGLVAASPGPRQ